MKCGRKNACRLPPKKSCLSSCENIRYRAQSKSNIVNFHQLSSSCSCLETGYGLVFPIPESSCRVDLFRSKTLSGPSSSKFAKKLDFVQKSGISAKKTGFQGHFSWISPWAPTGGWNCKKVGFQTSVKSSFFA